MSRKAGPDNSAQLEVFQYLSCQGEAPAPTWEGWEALDLAQRTPDDAQAAGPARVEAGPAEIARGEAEAQARAEFERRLGEEKRRAFEAGREQGVLEGRQAERDAQAQAVSAAAQLRSEQAAELLTSFAGERDRFLLRVEQEVVELALAVAARILRREAQMDPLLLTGAVRVALGQLSASTSVKLSVPGSELDLWTEAMAAIPNLAIRPLVVAGDGMRLGDCQIETALGSVDLGIRGQLGEIERGFFDRAGGPRPVSTGFPSPAISTPAGSQPIASREQLP